MALEAALWSQLPPEILETGVLPFLPVQDLCRYRCVSKRWDHKICTPLFRTLCSQHPDSSCFVVRYLRNSADPDVKRHGWCFLDMKERRWYTVNDVEESVRHKFHSGAMAMDGGLFCQFSDSETPLAAGERSSEMLGQVIVYNPLAKTVKRLPTAPLHSGARLYPDLNMVVDGVSGSFKVFLINQDAALDVLSGRTLALNDPIMHIYDSATNEWKRSLSPVLANHGISRASSAVFRDHLYVFLTYVEEMEFITPLWRYDLVRDTWENVPVHLPTKLMPCPELVVAADRLFMFGWSTRNFPMNEDGEVVFAATNSWCFEVLMVDVVEMTREPYMEISEAQIMLLLDSRLCANEDVKLPSSLVTVSAIGNSLIFISVLTGNMIEYDLVTGCLGREWPPIPMGHFGDSTRSAYGKEMKLLP